MKDYICYIAPEAGKNGDGSRERPFGNFSQVFSEMRRLRQEGYGAYGVTVYVRGGEYPLDAPIVIPADLDVPFSIEAYGDEKPVFSGGRRIGGLTETRVNGARAFEADVSELTEKGIRFRSLFVNGERRERTRLPERGEYVMADVPGVPMDLNPFDNMWLGTNAFCFNEGEWSDFRNPKEIDVVAHHFWVDERMPVESIDLNTKTVTSSVRSVFILKNDNNKAYASYYIENVFEALKKPGQWYLDGEAGKLYYLPMEGETLENTGITVPVVSRFLIAEGDPEAGRVFRHLSLRGISFEYADWYHTRPLPESDVEYLRTGSLTKTELPLASSPQAALHCPGVLSFRGCRGVMIENCAVRHIGFYGIELRHGTCETLIRDCVISDTGAGGVRMTGSAFAEAVKKTCHHNCVENTLIEGCGRVFRSGIGILLVNASQCRLVGNTIRDLYYTGISVGWSWGFGPSMTKENLIENNHIYDLGKGVLSDMGGIYTLGLQPGTVIRGNHIHDVRSRNYGGWGIYLDEGSSFITVENNYVHHTSNQCFNQHYGRENTVRNNVFAFSSDCVIHVQRAQIGRAYWPVESYTRLGVTFIGNIIVSDGKPFHMYDTTLPEEKLLSSVCNCYWNTASGEGAAAAMADYRPDKETHIPYSMDQLRAMGVLRGCLLADPLITLLPDTFLLDPASPALETGFVPFDPRRAGVRRAAD